ncbi:MAG: selenium cofactor biosynthesis protein YqeC [Haloquadratum sp.]|jgi:probable selenium-dependent hydroxylase accessory protein YqeC|nr:selenium cofactor biosynthesis protein YqeC [Haloferacaceae archaeon]MDR9445405.1 selenium cofactor biosynthesis protein YqeC [Haloquadratum sp.]
MSTPALVEAFRADDGITAVVGAGGKKTLMRRLSASLETAVVTATVRIPPIAPWVATLAFTDDPVEAVRSATEWPVGVLAGTEGPDRRVGYPPATVDAIGTLGHPVLVKADGARMRRFKAPGEAEPQLPQASAQVVWVVSVGVVGAPLSAELVHRPDHVAALTGRPMGDPITAADLATVATHPEGGRKRVPPDASYIVCLNMVDDAARTETARAVARRIGEADPDVRVVLTSLTADAPVIGVH